MMKDKVKDFHFVVGIQFTVLALQHPVTVVAKIGQHHTTVGQIGDFYLAANLQVGRTNLTVGCIEVGIALIIYTRQFLPVTISQVAGYGIERGGVGLPFVVGKTEEKLRIWTKPRNHLEYH